MKDIIQYQDFAKLDLRVGKVIAAEVPDWSNKLLKFTVEFGEEVGQRTILAGVKNYYKPEEFEGNNYIFIVNLAPRKMGPAESQGMMLMVENEAGEPIKIESPEQAQPGDIIC